MTTRNEKLPGRRVTIDLTAAAAEEVERLRSVTELAVADLFRHALSLIRIYVQARAKGHELRIVDPEHPDRTTIIEFPMHVRRERVEDGGRNPRLHNAGR